MVKMTTFTTDDRLYAEKDGSFTIDCRLKPLTEKQIHELIVNKVTDYELCRAIEEAHGIR
jgi:hypothetical protein